MTSKTPGNGRDLSIYFLSFAILLILSAAALLTSFLWLQDGEDLAGLAASAKTHWSQSADFLGAVIGIPTALAGSLVAIFLAQRAYAVSRQQSRFEAQIYLEQAATHLAETYWTLAAAYRHLDEAHNAMLIDLARAHQTNGKITHIEPETLTAFRTAIAEIATALLAIHKDPLAYETWKHLPHAETAGAIDAARDKALALFTTGPLRPIATQTETRDLGELSQALVVMNRNDTLLYGHAHSLRTLKQQLVEFGPYRLCADGLYRDPDLPEAEAEPRNFVSAILSEKKDQISIFDLRDLDAFPGSRLALMGEYLHAVYGPSVFADQAGAVPSNLMLRDGAFLLAAILHSWPTPEVLDQVADKFIADRGLQSVDAALARRILRDKNIPDYAPRRMRSEAEAFLTDTRFMVAPSPSVFMGC